MVDPTSRSPLISIKIILPTAFVRHTDGQKQLTSHASNLPALIADIDQNFPALATQIKDESGKLRRFINVYVNDEDIRFLGGDSICLSGWRRGYAHPFDRRRPLIFRFTAIRPVRFHSPQSPIHSAA